MYTKKRRSFKVTPGKLEELWERLVEMRGTPKKGGETPEKRGEPNEDLPKTAPATWELDLAYEYADKYSRDHGFRIYNATRGGFLEKFERVSFDEVVK